MPYDEDLADRVRRALARRKALTEKQMFGGVAFMLHGHMCCGVLKDELILRLGGEQAERALRRRSVRPFDITGRAMKGFVMVKPKGCATDEALKRWLGLAAKFVSTLPAKPAHEVYEPRWGLESSWQTNSGGRTTLGTRPGLGYKYRQASGFSLYENRGLRLISERQRRSVMIHRFHTCRRQFATGLVCILALGGSLSANQRTKRPTITDPAKAGTDFALQGEYVGTLTDADGQPLKFGVQVVARGDGQFDAIGYRGGLPGAGGDPKTKIKAADRKRDGVAVFPDLLGGAVIEKKTLKISSAEGKTIGVLERVHRKSPTLGAKPPKGAIVLFHGTVDDFEPGTTTKDKLLDVFARRSHQTSNYKFKKDFRLHLEFRTPYMPHHRGQDRGNSGVHLPGIREIQVLDTFGEEGKRDECGAFYGWKPPALNMCFPPLSWQTYDVDVKVATFDDEGNSASPTIVTVRHNGIVVHEKVQQDRRRRVAGPLRLQYHDNPVHYRNIWVVEEGGGNK